MIKIDKGKCQEMATSLDYMIPGGRSVLVTVEGLKEAAESQRGALKSGRHLALSIHPVRHVRRVCRHLAYWRLE